MVTLDYDFRDILIPLFEYIEYVNTAEFPDKVLTVVIPEFVSNSIWENLLHNQTANLLRMRLQIHKDIVIIDVPYQIGQRGAIQARQQKKENNQEETATDPLQQSNQQPEWGPEALN